MKRWSLIIVLLFLLLFLDLEATAQCSQCKLLAKHSGDASDDLLGGEDGNNINTAILYIMAVPYIILSFLFRNQIKRFFKKAFSSTK